MVCQMEIEIHVIRWGLSFITINNIFPRDIDTIPLIVRHWHGCVNVYVCAICYDYFTLRLFTFSSIARWGFIFLTIVHFKRFDSRGFTIYLIIIYVSFQNIMNTAKQKHEWVNFTIFFKQCSVDEFHKYKLSMRLYNREVKISLRQR